MPTKKASRKKPAKKVTAKKSTEKTAATKKSPAKKKAAKKTATGKNKLGVKNSLVNNINARKKKDASRTKKKSTVSAKAYDKLQNNWGKKKK